MDYICPVRLVRPWGRRKRKKMRGRVGIGENGLVKGDMVRPSLETRVGTRKEKVCVPGVQNSGVLFAFVRQHGLCFYQDGHFHIETQYRARHATSVMGKGQFQETTGNTVDWSFTLRLPILGPQLSF